MIGAISGFRSKNELAAIARVAAREMFAATGKEGMFVIADESAIEYGKKRGAGTCAVCRNTG